MTLKKFFYLESLKKISDGTSPKKTDPGPIPSLDDPVSLTT